MRVHVRPLLDARQEVTDRPLGLLLGPEPRVPAANPLPGGRVAANIDDGAPGGPRLMTVPRMAGTSSAPIQTKPLGRSARVADGAVGKRIRDDGGRVTHCRRSSPPLATLPSIIPFRIVQFIEDAGNASEDLEVLLEGQVPGDGEPHGGRYRRHVGSAAVRGTSKTTGRKEEALPGFLDHCVVVT